MDKSVRDGTDCRIGPVWCEIKFYPLDHAPWQTFLRMASAVEEVETYLCIIALLILLLSTVHTSAETFELLFFLSIFNISSQSISYHYLVWFGRDRARSIVRLVLDIDRVWTAAALAVRFCASASRFEGTKLIA